MKLGKILRAWRETENRQMEDVASEIGISKATLSRLERDNKIRSDVFAKLLLWLFS